MNFDRTRNPHKTLAEQVPYVMGQRRGLSTVVCGVYCITCLVNGKRYVGSSDNIPNRWRVHRSRLDRGIHPAEEMMADWETYGSSAFRFRILERVDVNLHVTAATVATGGFELDKLMAAEQKWIDQLKPEYNTLTVAGSSTGYKHTEEAKEAMRAAKRGRKRPYRKGAYESDPEVDF